MSKPSLKTLSVLLFAILPTIAFAQSASTGVDVGPGYATGEAEAQGDIFQFGDTTSHVDGNGSFGSAVAVGVGQDGISFSHSLGANGGGNGFGHNINMTIGREGSHVSSGQVHTQGGNSRVRVGGGSGQYPGGISGGNYVEGYGTNTQARSESNTQRFPLGGFLGGF